MSITDAIKGLEDKVFYEEGDGTVTIKAKIDTAKLEKNGKTIDYFANRIGDMVYDKSTSTSFTSWLLGEEGNTQHIKSNKDAYIASGKVKYATWADGIFRSAYDTNYAIVVNKKEGTVSITYENKDHQGYAARAATNACEAFYSFNEYLVSNKAAKKDPTPEDGKGKGEDTKPDETKEENLEKKVEGEEKAGKEAPKQTTYDKNSAAYKGALDVYTKNNERQYADLSEAVKNPEASFENFLKENPKALEAFAAQMKAIEAQKEAAANQPEVKNLADTRKPLPNLKDGNVKKK